MEERCAGMGDDACRPRRMVDALCAEFDEVIAPVLVDGVIRMRPIDSADELPTGVTDDQGPGSYRATATGGLTGSRTPSDRTR
jgi:hypothetical protein